MTPADKDVRFCTYCGTHKPIGEFRRRKKSDDSRRVNQCSGCHSRAMRAYRASRKEKALDNFVRRASRTTDPRLLNSFVGLAIQQFGGVEEFVRLYHAYAKSAPPPRFQSVLTSLVNISAAAVILNPRMAISRITDREFWEAIIRHMESVGLRIVVRRAKVRKPATDSSGAAPPKTG